MTRNSAAASAALMIGAFAVSFFATMLIRKSAPSTDVAPSAWTAEAAAAGNLREREESLSRSVISLRTESQRLSAQLARKSQDLAVRVGKVREAGAAAGTDPKALPALDGATELIAKMMVRDRLRMAQEELGLNPAQMATYQTRLKDAVDRDPLLLIETNAVKCDEEALLPLLDRDQLAQYHRRLKTEAESRARSDSKRFAELLGISPELGARVNEILKEEGVNDGTAFTRMVAKPAEGTQLVPHYAAAADRARVRLRPLLSPEAFERLERHFADETESLKALVEELEKETKKKE